MRRLLIGSGLLLAALLALSLAAGEILTRPARAAIGRLLVQLPLRLDLSAAQLRPVDAITTVRAPLLIASGSADLHTRWPETEALFAAAPSPKTLWRVAGAAHVDLHRFDPAAYEARLLPWLQAQLRKAPG